MCPDPARKSQFARVNLDVFIGVLIQLIEIGWYSSILVAEY
jgi:hypothetical protein